MTQNEKNFLIQKIRSEYTEPMHTELDELRALDRKVRRPAEIFGYTFGGISVVIMGSGMSLIMTEIGASLGSLAMPLGIVIGAVGLLGASLCYPIYKKILKSRKDKYRREILEISETLENKGK